MNCAVVYDYALTSRALCAVSAATLRAVSTTLACVRTEVILESGATGAATR